MSEQDSITNQLDSNANANLAIMTEIKASIEATQEILNKIQASLPLPDQNINNVIWLIVIIAFALVMVGSAYVLGTGVTTKLDAGPAEYVTKGETILTVFTTVVGFLAGLLTPSPVKK